MPTLTLRHLDQQDHLTRPQLPDFLQPGSLQLNSPALSVMNDFSLSEPSLIGLDTPAIDAERQMRSTGMHLKLVVDQQRQLVGLLSLNDLSHQAIIQRVSKGVPLKAVCVEDFMWRRKELHAFDLNELAGASIRDLVETLRTYEPDYCLIVDSGRHEIRGVISVRDIFRSMNLRPDTAQSPSFIGLFNALQPPLMG
jgi:DeoR family transcriptional regulator, catabolite repression regulator